VSEDSMLFLKSEPLDRKSFSDIFPLSWSHYILLSRIENKGERSFYEIESAQENWSVRELQRKINSGLFERLALSKDKKKIKQLAANLYLIDNNVLRWKAATHCFMLINHIYLRKYLEVPIVTIFPAKMGFQKTEIPVEIISRVKGEFSFSDQTGLNQLYENLKASPF
jgi:hypothetical protein